MVTRLTAVGRTLPYTGGWIMTLKVILKICGLRRAAGGHISYLA